MNIMIAGDLVPTKENQFLFENAKILENFDDKLKELWINSDFRILNLECVLGEKSKLHAINKNGPNLIANCNTINGLIELNLNLVLLANNHIMDYGLTGLNNTIKLLDDNNIKYTGVIDNMDIHMKPYIFEKNGIKVGIYNLCENEFSVATKNSKGTNAFYSIKNYEDVLKLKKKVDYVIVVFHGGKEFYRYPSPNQQEISHLFVDNGADVVIFQHSHCIGCEENYKNKKIIYGQGNFIFHGKNDKYWNTELLIELNLTKAKLKIKYHPIETNESLIQYSNNRSILNDFNQRSKEILKHKFIEDKYNEFSLKHLNNYLYNLHGMNLFDKIIKKMNFKNFFLKKYKLKSLLAIQNIIECEAHRELLLNGLKNRIKEIEKDVKK